MPIFGGFDILNNLNPAGLLFSPNQKKTYLSNTYKPIQRSYRLLFCLTISSQTKVFHRENLNQGNDEQQLPTARQDPTGPTFATIENRDRSDVDHEDQDQSDFGSDEEEEEDSGYNSETLGEEDTDKSDKASATEESSTEEADLESDHHNGLNSESESEENNLITAENTNMEEVDMTDDEDFDGLFTDLESDGNRSETTAASTCTDSNMNAEDSDDEF
ncbi:hypothetical protein PtA15_13A255 [Puccinia triticina]|uniref:Uncharacterized protein n=1 Tax=Puccinia triticina TaxID=208348 RepID=A0ABY7D1T8_9BASI|nr:uncharacterized protein PtA15_13A255 [Puccinia triticina]WAQ90855.1 hypothetical protein PtA15_13A255 [Puccinia triticina]